MLKGLYTAYTAMVNEQHRMDTMTNNLANASTVGFKKEGATSQCFSDVLTVKIKDRSDGHHAYAEHIGRNNPGVKIGENYTDYTQGSYRVTGNTYDLAIDGDGFFAIEFTNKAGETSTMYTRAGQFTLNNVACLGCCSLGPVHPEQGRVSGERGRRLCAGQSEPPDTVEHPAGF